MNRIFQQRWFVASLFLVIYIAAFETFLFLKPGHPLWAAVSAAFPVVPAVCTWWWRSRSPSRN